MTLQQRGQRFSTRGGIRPHQRRERSERQLRLSDVKPALRHESRTESRRRCGKALPVRSRQNEQDAQRITQLYRLRQLVRRRQHEDRIPRRDRPLESHYRRPSLTHTNACSHAQRVQASRRDHLIAK